MKLNIFAFFSLMAAAPSRAFVLPRPAVNPTTKLSSAVVIQEESPDVSVANGKSVQVNEEAADADGNNVVINDVKITSSTLLTSPGQSENSLFTCEPCVAFWRDFQSTGDLSAQQNLAEVANIASRFASMGPGGWSYFLSHAGRSGYFAANAALGMLASGLHERYVANGDLQLPFDMNSSTATRLILEAFLCYEQDYACITNGEYNLPWDMKLNHRQSSPINVITQTSRFVNEAIGTLARRKRQREEDKKIWITDPASPSLYPQYYQNAFHYQTDGWMSKRSADVYETSTETLFLGRQDSMQRTSLSPIVQYSKRRDEKKGPMKVLEVACGTGRFMSFLRDQLDLDTEFTAVDLSPYYLDAARENDAYWRKTRQEEVNRRGNAIGKDDIKPLRLIQAQAENLPFEDESFDAVVCIYLYHELPRDVRARVSAEMSRVLKKEGILVLTDSIQRGDRPGLDDRICNFEAMNEPYYVDYTEDDLPNHFIKEGLQPMLVVPAKIRISRSTVSRPSLPHIMAYLLPPLRIIDTTDQNPPAATWFDEDRQHFVALRGSHGRVRTAEASITGSIDSSVLAGGFYGGDEYEATTEVVQYQAFGLPNSDQSQDTTNEESDDQQHSAFDAAKRAAKSTRNTLSTEISVSFPLPHELANIQNEDDASSTGVPTTRRIPILAKFSEAISGERYLALQYTPTMVRLVNVTKNADKQWTIDLAHDTNPIASPADSLPTFPERQIDTTIIGGGIIWCIRGPRQNLLLITTNSVILYEISNNTLTKKQIFPHNHAISFWYEASSRVLVIGSYKSNPNESNFPKIVMEMKTLFFTESSVETLPLFVVGSLRERNADLREGGGKEAEHEEEEDVVLPTDLSLVCLHGEVFCVELGSLGSRKGIGLIKLDRVNRGIYVRQHESKPLASESSRTESTYIGVVDNLLCIFLSASKSTLFIDVSFFSDDPRVFKDVIDIASSKGENDARIYDGSLSFLAPSYFLETDGEGLLFQVKVQIDVLLQAMPSTACLVSLLLRREEPRSVMLQHIMQRFDALVKNMDSTTLKAWFGVIVEDYSKSETAIKWDSESTDDLLLSVSTMLEPDKLSLVDEIVAPGSCRSVLTQAEVLQFILLKHAQLALEESNTEYLDLVSSMSAHYLVEIERKELHPCFSLQCLVIALLSKHHSSSELCSYLCARETLWAQVRRRRQLNLPSPGGMYFDLPGVAVPYAELLFKIATSCSCTTRQRLMISHATSILIGCWANATAVKCLLSAGHLEDAISICSKKTRPQKDATSWEDAVQADEFFNMTVEKAREMENIGDRCKLFYHLHCFLRSTFPAAFTLESRKIKINRRSSFGRKASFSGEGDMVAIEQSKLAHECKFPDDLFAGSNAALCMRLRLLFGYCNI